MIPEKTEKTEIELKGVPLDELQKGDFEYKERTKSETIGDYAEKLRGELGDN